MRVMKTFGRLDADVGDSVGAPREVAGQRAADGEEGGGEGFADDCVDGEGEGEVRGSASVKG